DLELLRFHLAVARKGVLRILGELLYPIAQLRRVNVQVLRCLHIGHASVLDQAHSLKLELASKLPSLHDPPPVPSKHLTRCLRNRVQASLAWSKLTARCGPQARRVQQMTFYIRGFGCFVASTTAPIAAGWSESCQVGLSSIRNRAFARRTFFRVSRFFRSVATIQPNVAKDKVKVACLKTAGRPCDMPFRGFPA